MGGYHNHLLSNAADDDYRGDGIPLTDAQRWAIVVIHFCALPAVALSIYCLMKNIRIFEERVWSPFLLLTSLTWLQMAAAFEIGNHFYVDNWQIYDPQADLVNGSFFFFNFGAQNLLALSLRKKGVSFIRKGANAQEWIAIILDPIMLVLIVVNPIVYGAIGRSTAVTALSPLASIAGVFTLFRTWFNLGPNIYTKLGGIFFFVMVILGVVMLAVYRALEAEWVHALIGGSFIASTIPLSIAFWNTQLLEEDVEENDKDDTQEGQQGEHVSS